MGMRRHKAVGIDFDFVTVFIFDQKIIIDFLGPIGFEEPVFVVALPGNVEGGGVVDDEIAGLGRHDKKLSKEQARE